ncbi:ferrichrome ABC transporter permease [Acetobacter aceti NRIC 0242]|uniref:ABC transporter permease n=1 Tax=Acetobacter aceti NBRC 14818 TaxID=887700 RepID=A0AB33IAI3_ACEAC|nr:iron ABC transporter permease [Acetobacter aceti]TCS34973.1 iron complex transport system permease protein [Acetobacter aceti NBRC 14818]BCK74447.1 ABC transporter permease [Acetobacter aceti NBRC 14818]GAN55956.1 ABC transporter ferrichrome Fe3+-siderophore transporter [Acetobacter aceti NBRC 14818]GBO80205.1 ferrichrome ABC transporter permease [Acetobacter aceti NRIC 0242]
MTRHPDRILLITLTTVLLLLFGLALVRGETMLPFLPALEDLLAGRDTVGAVILGQLRLPRALLAVMIGGSLGLSGAVLQGYLRNPLADPGLLGVSSGAALGAVLVFYTGLAGAFSFALPLGGLAGALLAVALLLGLAGQGGVVSLLLAGTALTSFFAAMTALTLNLVPSPYASFEIMHWLMGSLADRTMLQVWLCLPGILLGSLLMAMSGPVLDALTLGDEVAESLGFTLKGVWGAQNRIVLGSALAIGSGVAVAGAIGFIGLVVPHLLRPLTGHRPGRLLLPSFLGGAILLLVADICARFIPTHTELHVGVLTALTGAPLFFWRVSVLRRNGS